jgi:hypothetical protein
MAWLVVSYIIGFILVVALHDKAGWELDLNKSEDCGLVGLLWLASPISVTAFLICITLWLSGRFMIWLAQGLKAKVEITWRKDD